MADLGHQGHLESDKHEETFKEIYDGFSFSVVCLSTFSPTHLGWLGSDRGVLTMCFYRCEFMLASMSKKKNTPLLKTDMTLNSGLIPDYGLSQPSHLISGWSN